MPETFAHQLRGKRPEAHSHRDAPPPLEHAKTGVKKFSDGKTAGSLETRSGPLRIADAGQGKGAQLVSIKIVAEQVPLIIDATEVIRPDSARLRARFARGLELAVMEPHFFGAQHCAAEQLEGLQVGQALANAAERDGGIEIAPGKRDLIFQAFGDFFESAAQRLLERRAS